MQLEPRLDRLIGSLPIAIGAACANGWTPVSHHIFNPVHRLDHNAAPGALQQPVTAARMATAHDMIPLGGAGAGKTHIAILGMAAIHYGKRAHSFDALDLIWHGENGWHGQDTGGAGWCRAT